MAAGSEIKGSRKQNLSNMNQAVRLFVSDDGTTSIPLRGDLYPGETGVTARRVVDVQTEPEQLPGLFYHVVQYANYWPYT